MKFEMYWDGKVKSSFYAGLDEAYEYLPKYELEALEALQVGESYVCSDGDEWRRVE